VAKRLARLQILEVAAVFSSCQVTKIAWAVRFYRQWPRW
jgi:hypothetical protein